MMKRMNLLTAAVLLIFGFAAQMNVVAQNKKPADAPKQPVAMSAGKRLAAIPYQTFKSYFETNDSGLQGDASYLAFTSDEQFGKVFHPAATTGNNEFLPDNAFDSKLVVAVINRGNMLRKYTIESVTAKGENLVISYKTKDEAMPTATFNSHLILAVDKRDYRQIVFMANGKRVGAVSAQETVVADDSFVPIVGLKVRGLIGGVQNGNFVGTKSIFGKVSDAKYNLFGLKDGDKSELRGAQPLSSAYPCDDLYIVEFQPTTTSGVAIGANANWNPRPRPLKQLALTGAVYKKAVTDVLKSNKLAKSPVKITQAVSVDLDGDGTQEVLINGSYHKNKSVFYEAKAGDYSFLLVRKTVAGKAQDTIIDSHFVTEDNAKPDILEFSAIADLNGDGTMEIVYYSQYHEGDGAGVYEMKDGKFVRVKELGVGCGS